MRQPYGGGKVAVPDRVWGGSPTSDFVAEVAAYPGAEAVGSCMQCGVCSGSCPMAGYSSETPRRVMAHVLAGDRERALGSSAIWYCASCFACASRCPQGVSVTDVMYALRSMAPENGPSFYRAFTKGVVTYGRAYEAGVAMRVALARGPRATRSGPWPL